MRTSSLTITPPVSNAAFQFRPKSFLLILPVIEKPAFVFPYGSLVTPPNSTFNFTFLVTSLIVRSPYRLKVPSISTFSAFVAMKVISGNFSASKKSALFRCASLCSLFVVILLTAALNEISAF
jgi:hypothetical protein